MFDFREPTFEFLPSRANFLKNLTKHLSEVYRGYPHLQEEVPSHFEHLSYRPDNYAAASISLVGRAPKPTNEDVSEDIDWFVFNHSYYHLKRIQEQTFLLEFGDGLHSVYGVMHNDTLHIHSERYFYFTFDED